MKKVALTSLVALLLLTSACGGEEAPSSTADGKKIVRALSSALTDDSQGVQTKDATCIATRFVDAMDTEPLVRDKVVTKAFRYVDGAVDTLSGRTRSAYGKAKARCLEDKIAKTMLSVISAKGSIVSSKKAPCVARAFTRGAGYDRLVAGQAVTTQLAYVSNGAIQTPGNAAAYAKALEKCLGATKVTTALSKTVEDAFAAGAGGPAVGNVDCLVKDFVGKVGVTGLYENKVVQDTGAFNAAGAKYDEPSAKLLATAILGCVDALQSQAQAAASTDKSLDVATLEACLKKSISTDFLRDDFLVNQLLGKNAAAQAAAAEIQSRSQTCENAQR